MPPVFDTILFDLGGVLIRFDGFTKMLEWTNWKMTLDELWHRWLTSPTVRNFDTGKSDSEEFARGIIAEFELPVNTQQFLREFSSWLKELFPGTITLLQTLSSSFELAILSNINILYWDKIDNQLGLIELFPHKFLSFETGLLKPDKKTFEFVVNSLKRRPERVLFFDDNQLNVDGAASAGIVSYKTRGTAEVESQLKALGLL